MDPNGKVQVVVACPEGACRSSITESINASDRLTLVAEVDGPREALDAARGRGSRPVIVMTTSDVDDLASVVQRCSASFPVVIVAPTDGDPMIPSVLRAGAAACLVGSSLTGQQIVEATTKAAIGDSYLAPPIITRLFDEFRRTPQRLEGPGGELTEREREIMGLVAQGLRNRQIAAALFLTEKTVKNHINHIYGKLKVGDRAEAIRRWSQAG